jgi:hypothetical protein
LAAVVYGENGSPEFSAAVSTVRRYLGHPETKSKAHQLGNLDVLRNVFEKGGFMDIETHTLDLQLDLESAEECVQYLQATSPTLQELISPLPESAQVKVWDAVQQDLGQFEGELGFALTHKVIVAKGNSKT